MEEIVHNLDLLTVRGRRAILWEVKSINTSGNNEESQIALAVGKLPKYVYGIITDEEYKDTIGKPVEAILLSQKPAADKGYLKHLETEKGIYTFWLENGNITGTDSAMKMLYKFLEEAQHE